MESISAGPVTPRPAYPPRAARTFARAWVAWASKPVLRLVANAASGMQFGSLRSGPVYPILTHMLFGFIGALVAVLLWRATERAADR